MCGAPCCPGKTSVKKIPVGGQLIGISFLDQIIDRALASEGLSDHELRSQLLKDLKVYNYVPQPAEGDYLEAVWAEYLMERSKRRR